ncbi:MAG: hypothetical protein HY277_08765 [Ignavibacteriales bacterium]|nr:hypothetical protein [Ignavibacteriales bacterium]
MKLYTVVLIIVIAAAPLLAGNPPGGTKGEAGFDKLKSLVGSWKGKDSEGKPVTISYKLVSAGTSVMETLDMAENHDAMITMYHMNGDKLMMTHYCSLGNQPRMRAEKAAKDGNTIAFSFMDVTNLATKDDNYMKKLVFTFKDDDHFSQQWTMRMKGNQEHPDVFEFERVK